MPRQHLTHWIDGSLVELGCLIVSQNAKAEHKPQPIVLQSARLSQIREKDRQRQKDV